MDSTVAFISGFSGEKRRRYAAHSLGITQHSAPSSPAGDASEGDERTGLTRTSRRAARVRAPTQELRSILGQSQGLNRAPSIPQTNQRRPEDAHLLGWTVFHSEFRGRCAYLLEHPAGLKTPSSHEFTESVDLANRSGRRRVLMLLRQD